MRSLLLTPLLFILVLLPLKAANYFWIGDGGNWSDISHWATTSGGNVTHAQAPTADDDVFFDANSFTTAGQVVVFNTDIIFFRNLSVAGITNTPTLRGGSNVTLNCYGNLELTAAMVLDFTGASIFASSNPGNSIDFGPHTAGQDLTFSGAGSWTLNGPLDIDSTLLFTEGTLNTNDQNIDCQYFHSRGTANRTLDLGASQITIGGTTLDPNGIPESQIQPLRIQATNLTINPGTSTVELTDNRVDAWFEGPGTIDLNRLFLSSPTGSAAILPWLSPNGMQPAPTVNYNELELRHPTTLLGSANLGRLILRPGQRYIFEGGETFSLTELVANGDCLADIAISSNDDANPVNFTSPNAITADFLTLRGISANGAGSFTANNGIDLGNNPGWTINARTSQQLFWVGGAGNWTDPNHWSTTSGGPGGVCIPSSADDVFFDANSFTSNGQTVTVDVENASCRNMDWTGATNTPVLRGPALHNLRLSGSLTFVNNMQHAFDGSYFFESNQAGNTITTAGLALLGNLTFSGSTGEWTLLDDLYVVQSMYLDAGTLRTNDQNVNINRFYSETEQVRTLDLGSTHFLMDFRFFTVPVWDVNSTNLTFLAGTSVIESAGPNDNLFRNGGSGTMVFNTVLFSALRGRLFSLIDFPGPTLEIDSLIFEREGFISGNNRVNYWEMTAGFSYDFVSGVTQTIDELVANGNCTNGLVYIQSSNTGQTTNFEINNDHVFDRLFIRGIQQTGSGQLTANNSVDAGDNSNWTFTPSTGITLYWINDAGDWNDQAHWSFFSGGPGGACIPTPLDDVVFDENSFSTANPTITNINSFQRYCRDFTVTAGVTENPDLGNGFIDIFGSLSLQAPVRWFIANTKFQGNDTHSIFTNGNMLRGIDLSGNGTYELADPLNSESLNVQNGTFRSNDHDITINTFFGGFFNTRVVDFGDSYIRLIGDNVNIFTGVFNVLAPDITFLPGDYTIEVTGAVVGMILRSPIQLNRIIYSNPAATSAYFETFEAEVNSLSFFGPGEVIGHLDTDSLFCAPGKSYVLASGETHRINEHWRIIGNNCTPIELSSSLLGNAATVQMPATADIIADFIQMRDITATGGANFLAGARSTDIANSNVGWTFESRPEIMDVGFLGPDRALCSGDPITLNAFNFSPGETYLWNDNSTDAELTVDQSGVYSVRVEFENNCVIRDTIEVVTAQDFSVELMDGLEGCTGENLTLNADVGIAGAAYLWQDGSSDPELNVTVAGEYSVTVDLGGCMDSDTTTVAFNVRPNINLGSDLSRCTGETFTLSTSEMADTYLWQDNSNMNTFTGNQAGIYWLEAANGSCSDRDSVTVTYLDASTFDLGSDTLLCEADDLLLSPEVPGASYVWQDGSTGNTFLATDNGQYFVDITVQGCTASDTINLEFLDFPAIDIDDQVSACAGEEIMLTTQLAADNYNWSNGSNTAMATFTNAGPQFLELSVDNCTVRKDFEVSFNAIPSISSLGNDTTICENTSLTLSAQTDVGTITWQDNSTNDEFQLTQAGTYFYTADNQGCLASDTIIIDVQEDLVLDLQSSYAECSSNPFALTTTVVADSYVWSNGDTGPTFNSVNPGNYTLSVTEGNCVTEANFELSFVNPPAIDLGADTTICSGTFLTLNVGQEGEWQDGTVANNYTISAAGLYFVEVANGNCTARDSVVVDLAASPVFDLGDDQMACAGDSIRLSASTSQGDIIWEDGSDEPVRSIGSSGLYWLAIESGNGCVGRDSIQLDFSPLPVLDLGPDTTVCDERPFVIQPLAGEGTLTWSDGSSSPDFTVLAASQIFATLESQGCLNRDTINVAFRECSFFQVYVPNAFSPDFDGINDEFGPLFAQNLEITSFKMDVFSRWGDHLFSSNDVNNFWDGSSRGKALATGVYLYIIELEYVDDNGPGSHKTSGDLMLVDKD